MLKRTLKDYYNPPSKKQKLENNDDICTTNINQSNDQNNSNFMDVTQLKCITYNWEDNATIIYCKTFLDESRCQKLFEEALSFNYEQGEINIFGKKTKLPRLQSWMADDNITSDLTHYPLKQPSHKWTNNMLYVKNSIEKLLNCKFDYVHIHYYRDGKDYIGWHADKEAKKKKKNVVASLSLGGTRKFVFRHNLWKKNKIPKKEFLLKSGCLIVMKDDTQKKW
eukprot:365428_1